MCLSANRLGFLLLGVLAVPVLASAPRFGEVAGPAANTPKPVTAPAGAEAANPTPISVPAPSPRPALTPDAKYDSSSLTKASTNLSAPIGAEVLLPLQQGPVSITNMLKQGAVQYIDNRYGGGWQVQTSKVLCSLRQPLPNLGYAEFHQGTGQPLEFLLHVNNPPLGSGTALLSIESPLWSHYTHATQLGEIELEAEENTLTASASWAQRMLEELKTGMLPSLQFYDAGAGQDDVKITLSALNFNPGLQGFDTCRAQLLRYDIEQVHVSVLQFNTDSSKLGKQANQQLEAVLEVLKSDASISSIDIELYSQTKELVQYNYRLATRRARSVRDYLLHKGIDEDRIKITIHTKQKSKLEQLGIKSDQVQVVLHRDKKPKG